MEGRLKKILAMEDIQSKSDELEQAMKRAPEQNKILIQEEVMEMDDPIFEMDEVVDNILYLYSE